MSAEKKYTERDLVMAKREAWVECDGEFVSTEHPRYEDELARSRRMAAKRYPLPMVTRPRVVKSGRFWYRVLNETIQVSDDKGLSWGTSMFGYATANAIADLLANPTEEVEDES